jgi:chaperonin cofactor prefoldin
MKAFLKDLTDLSDFREVYFPSTKIWRFIANVKEFFAPDDLDADIEALSCTIADLVRQKQIISAQLTFLRWELIQKEDEKLARGKV